MSVHSLQSDKSASAAELAIPEDVAEVEKTIQITQRAPLENDGDDSVVYWDGPDDQDNPQNWSAVKITLNITCISILTFLTPLASSMFAPGVPDVMKEFNTNRYVWLI